MSDAGITRLSAAEARDLTGQTDWNRLRQDEAAGVEPAEDVEDEAFDWLRAVTLQRPGKQAITIRLDEDVLAYFRGSGKGYQTRINRILRAYMDAQSRSA
jgi:uncharacterized protein (DUF4415 family)